MGQGCIKDVWKEGRAGDPCHLDLPQCHVTVAYSVTLLQFLRFQLSGVYVVS
jgi:hypothetical protein